MKFLFSTALISVVFLSLASSTLQQLTPTTPTAIDQNSTQCQSQLAMNAALLQMLLLNLQPTLRPTSSNEISAVQPLMTSTFVSTATTVYTMTETLSRVVSIWFRTQGSYARIPTTLYDVRTSLVSEYVTLTSTLIGTQGRKRRSIASLVESSFLSLGDDETEQFPTAQMQMSPSPDNGLLENLLTKPKVMTAWLDFLKVLQEESSLLHNLVE